MMAMPNLSRRSIQGTHRASFNSWFSNADSDSEEYESGQQIRRQQTTFTQKVTTTTKRIFISTVTTIMTIFTLIYGYTIGTVVGGITRGTADQGAEVSNTPLLLRPVQWIVDMVRYFTLIEVTFWAWLGKGQRRNILLWLLLFLLFAVPTYILYKGGEGSEEGWLTWITDGITNFLLMARSVLTAPISWISSVLTSVWSTVIMVVTTPVQWVISLISGLFTCVQYPFVWMFTASASQHDQMPVIVNSNAENGNAPVLTESVSNVPEEYKPTVYSQEDEIRSGQDIELLSKQILQTEAFKNLKNDLKSDFQVPESHSSLLLHITEELKQLKTNLENLKTESDQPADSKHYIFHALQREIKNLERRVRLLQLHQGTTKQCCDNMEEQVAAIVAGMFGGGGAEETTDAASLVKSKLSVLDNLEAKLAKFTAELEESQRRALEGFKVQMNQASEGTTTKIDLNSLSDERVRLIVREALAKYDADKTNMVDYALETSGGTILSTRCTENYDYKHGVTFYWGLSWFSKEYRPNNPRSIIQPNVHPGECWAFKGATGYVVIELSMPIQVMAVSMEHIPRSLAPNGKIESAPRDFSVWGLKELMDPEPTSLGKFRYEDNGQPLQTFEVNVPHNGFQKVELRIESNHGHLEYTCVYRFRVHGIPDIS